MKRLIAVLLLCLSFSQLANAATFWYQPTPYPLKKMDGTAMPQDIEKVHVWGGVLYYCSWCNNGAGITNFTRSDRLRTGGWGDRYDPFLKFDLVGLPADATFVALYLMPFPDSGTTTPFAFCSNDSTWDLSMVWGTQPNRSCYGYYAAPTSGTWWGIDITSWYNGWKNGTKFDGGISMFPQNTNNNFNASRSSAYADYAGDPAADGKRPILRLDFTPTLDLKTPLPGSHAWLVTTEVGGYDCKGDYDQYHDDVPNSQGVMQYNYFSVDFSWRNIPDSGATVYVETSNIPVVAAGGGTVATFPNDPNNGNYVVVTHGSTGFTTRYLHLKSISVSNGATVTQGDTLGYMGNTGISNGTHLHFGVRYNNSGAKTTPELAKVVMDGWVLKSFQTECVVDSTTGVPTDWKRYYRSGNRVY